MSMKANILRDALGNITIQMQGDLGYEHSIPLRNEINELVDDNPNSTVTIDLGGVDFVGSSGICHFVETITSINKDKKDFNKISLSNISVEFQKLLRLYSPHDAAMLWAEFEMDSDDTATMGQQFGARKRTFEN